MVPEGVRLADINPDRVHRLMTADIHHTEDRFPGRRRRSEKSATEAVCGIVFVIESQLGRVGLNDLGDGLRREPAVGRMVTAQNPPEHRAGDNASGVEIFAQGFNGTGDRTSNDRDRDAF
jgi:hypothetical protein